MNRGAVPALKVATAAAASRLAEAKLAVFAPLKRAQFENRGPWWWSRRHGFGNGGRVDLAAPDGTICFATSATGAVIEKIWDPGLADPVDPEPQLVLRTTLDRIIIWESPPPADLPDWTITNLTDAVGGLPKEFSSTDYSVTQGWADAIRQHAPGRGGVAYWLRLDPADGRGVAAFDEGPDDREPGFEFEAFPLAERGRASLVAAELPEQLFNVQDPPSDSQIVPAPLDAF